MFNKKIKELEAQKKLREIDLKMVHDVASDPMMSELYKSDLMVDIMHIESKIQFEKAMKPFKYMIILTILASTCMFAYLIIKRYL
jgi:hypothetical protein